MNTSKKNIVMYVSACLLVMLLILLVLEKKNIINLYNKPVKVADSVKPINTVNYSPPTPQEIEEGNQIKQNLIDSANSNSSTKDVTVNLSAYSQDNKGGPLIIRTITSAKNGTCTLVLSKSETTKSYSSQVINMGRYFGCDGFDIPASDLSNGKWQINLTVDSGDGKGSTRQEVEINV